MVEGRVCTGCEVFKEYRNFHKAKNGLNGHASICKECAKEKLNNYRRNNREKVRAWDNENYKKNRQHLLDRHKKSREKYKEQNYAVSKKWYQENKEYVSEKRKIYYQERKEHLNESGRKWYSENKDRAYANVLRRRSSKHFVQFKGVKRTELLDRDNWTCQKCGVNVHDRSGGGGRENRHLWDDETKAHLDHIIPLSRGGDSTPENIQVLCRTCNLSKSNTTDLEVDSTGQIKIML